MSNLKDNLTAEEWDKLEGNKLKNIKGINMVKGTLVHYHCPGVTKLNSGNNKNDEKNKFLFDNNEVFEIVSYSKVSPYATIRLEGTDVKGIKTRKDYLTIKK